MADFVHLHVHTEYSLLDGANRIKDLIKKTGELGMKSVAITDHGVMYGVIDFYKEALKNNIKPIIGCEVYMAKRTRFDKEPKIDSEIGHLILLAENNTGYKNLMKIVSAGFIDGFYYKPRIDFEILEKFSEGIIAMSACLSGDIPKAILRGDLKGAKEMALRYNKIFGEGNFFLELQINGIEEQNLVNQKLVELSRELSIPLVATNDAHYLRKEDARAHEILLCIQTGKNIDDEDRMHFSADEFYVKSPQEMQNLFNWIPEALENTVKIADRCNVEFDFNTLYLPEYKVPEDKNSYEYLRELSYKGLERLYKEKSKDEVVIKRLEYELEIIKKMDYVDYFLIVWDFIKYAKDNEIMVGPGRGSAAGSLISYSLGITTIDPLKYSLLFERFLNPERVSMPDIDIDFCFERRQEVIDYVVQKYGEDKVAQIITFGTMAARAAIRDVGRALNIPYSEVDTVAKMIPFQIGMNIEKALELNPDIKEFCKEDEKINELINTARLLEGMPRHASTHAAGVVISKDSMTEYVPLQKNDECVTTQFTMGLLEEVGLLKVDFLGLRTLTVIRDTIDLIKKNYGKDIDIEKIELEDINAYKLISEGKTSGVFQLESTGMTQFMKELQPTNLEDIIAGISLYRPGPMEHIPRYIKNKKNPSQVKYLHPLLENILDVTYGCMVYQEQVMQIVRELAGYSLGRSDLVRRAMAKKKSDIMQEERKNFIYGVKDENGNEIVKGAVNNGIDEKIADKIFDEMMDFASYAFNKSHAAAYAVIAYQTAWLKAYYPTEFMAALLNSFINSADKIPVYINECRRMGIEVLPPDINESDTKFTVVNNKIRFGMTAIKNVGEGAVIGIIREREKNGKYKSFKDFCQRNEGRDVNKRCVESLIKSGAFDSLGIYRSVLLATFEKIIDGINQDRKRNMEGQVSIFGLSTSSDKQEGNFTIIDDSETNLYPKLDEFKSNVLLSMEKEMLGIYISGHPLLDYEKEIAKKVTLLSIDLNSEKGIDEEIELNSKIQLKDNMKVSIGGIITSKKLKTTKSNNLMAFIEIEDLYGTMEIIVFPSTLSKYEHYIQEENIVLIKGKLSIREEEAPKIICEEVLALRSEEDKKVYIKVNDHILKEGIDSIYKVLKLNKGNIPVFLYNETNHKIKQLGREYWISLSEEIVSELKNKVGEESVRVV